MVVVESRDLFAAACFVFVVAMAILKDRVRAGRQRKAVSPSPDLAKGHILITGRKLAETRRILADFAKLYDLDAATFIVSDAGEGLRVRWKRPITTDIALYLVNYLTYPGDDGLSDRHAEAVGVIPMPAGIAPDGVSPGTLAKIFVPEGDTEHDLVHALTPDGRAFRISFTHMQWEPIAAPRAPALVDKTTLEVAR